MKSNTANDRQVGGDHYQTGGLQHWDLFGAEYLMATATKYMRWRKKGGIEDLEKALHYAEKLREGVGGGQWPERPGLNVARDLVDAWMRNYGLDWVEQTICIKLLYWKHSADIDEAIAGIQYLIETHGKIPTVKEQSQRITTRDTTGLKYSEMTNTEISDELARLTEDQKKATRWGAAVGVRHESIQEIRSEQARRERRVPRYENEAALKRPQFTNEHGTFEVGEMCTYQSNTNAQFVAKILDILQDGEAEIDLGVNGHSVVKWCRLSKLHVPRLRPLGPVPGDEDPLRQRTPEDGAQHASVAPWVVTEDWLGASGIDDPLVQLFWTRRAPGVHVLEPNVDTANIPRALRTCYNLKVGVGWVIDIRKCPPDAREYFPNLLREQNMKEWEDLPEWERGLYEWDEQGNKYSLGQFTEAWHVEAE